MAWSYDIATDTGKVRFLCGDTDTNDQLIQNEDIAFLLTKTGDNLDRAAAAACRAIAAKLYNSLTLDPADGSVSYDAKERADGFIALAEELEQQASMTGIAAGAGVYAGGISISDMETREQDTDRVQSVFTSDLHSTSSIDDRSD